MRLLLAVTVSVVFGLGHAQAQPLAPQPATASQAARWPQRAPLPEGTVAPSPVQPAAYQAAAESSSRVLPAAPASATGGAVGAPSSAAPSAAGSGGLALPPPTRHADASSAARGEAGSQRKTSGHTATSLVTIGTSLTLVLGLFLLVAWIMRKATPGQAVLLPKEVVEVLGRAPLAGRQQLHLLRCGNKLLLVSVMPGGVESLTEITEPMEVDRLCGLCRAARPDSATAVFRNVLDRMSRERVAPGADERSLLEAGYESRRRGRVEDDDV